MSTEIRNTQNPGAAPHGGGQAAQGSGVTPGLPDVESFLQFAQAQGFFFERSTIELLFRAQRKAFLLRGPPGTGKTSLAQLIAKFLHAELIFFQCTQGTGEEELLYKYIPSEETKSGIKITLGPLPRALEISKTKKVVLIIDEFDKTRPSADALLLDFLQNTRVSLYIDEKRTTIEGKPENLWIFLTSNDVREFSEPLLRRLTVIYLRPLPVSLVLNILRQRFSEEIALLLTQIYEDTLRAGLRKPATIQELLELGSVLTSGTSLGLTELLRSLVIKYDDDWQRFVAYVSTREPYRFVREERKEEDDVVEAYRPPESLQVEVKEEGEERRSDVSEVLQALRKIRVKEVKPQPVEPPAAQSEEEVTMRIKDEDFKAYTAVIQALLPEPTENPAKFGKFEVRTDDDGVVITSKEPMRLSEIEELKLPGEYYFEEEVVMPLRTFHEMIKHADRIRYYTKSVVFLEDSTSGGSLVKLAIEYEKDGALVYAKVRGYYRYDGKTKPGALGWLEDSRVRTRETLAEMLTEAIKKGPQLLDELPKKRRDLLLAVSVDHCPHPVTAAMFKNAVEVARRLKREYGFKAVFVCDAKKSRYYDLYFTVDYGTVTVGCSYSIGEKVGINLSVDVDDPRVEEVLARIEKILPSGERQ